MTAGILNREAVDGSIENHEITDEADVLTIKGALSLSKNWKNHEISGIFQRFLTKRRAFEGHLNHQGGRQKIMPNDNLHCGHRIRLRKRFVEEGLDGFDDHQVLELLLSYAIPRGDTNPTAHRLISRFGSLSAALEADPKDVARVEGIGENAAVLLSMIPQVTRRYFHDRVHSNHPKLSTPEVVAEYLIPLMAGRREEVFYVLCLDTQCRVEYAAIVSEGTLKEAAVYPRHVVEQAIRHQAASVILAHNHPAGTTKPSQQDHQLTRLLVQALGPLDIKVLDHIIVAGEETFSFAREGVLPDYEP
ncbi:RadC family protein [Geomonas azotofigens]|uniref:RadC family protein n=1 Tax=Geomonas azotofigens TaxID=2843196 RepID=UPI001C116835|nr:DNA repair protein RadC [Geomonas azotofigens]MBU5611617.1 DNA repair protein RadC [Geomonas azotofigens]